MIWMGGDDAHLKFASLMYWWRSSLQPVNDHYRLSKTMQKISNSIAVVSLSLSLSLSLPPHCRLYVPIIYMSIYLYVS